MFMVIVGKRWAIEFFSFFKSSLEGFSLTDF